jgi:hypothetical protein
MLTQEFGTRVVPALSKKFPMLRLGSGPANDVQGKLERDLFIRPCAIKQRNRRAESYKVQEKQQKQRVFQIVQESLNLLLFDVWFAADGRCPLNLLFFRQWIIIGDFSNSQHPAFQQIPAPSLRIKIKFQNILGWKKALQSSGLPRRSETPVDSAPSHQDKAIGQPGQPARQQERGRFCHFVFDGGAGKGEKKPAHEI